MAILKYGEYYTNLYLVVQWNKIKDLLIDGELIGLKGISSNKEGIALRWLDVRNVMIEMNATKCSKLNKIDKLKYDDADYLVKDNLYAINRICSNSDFDIYGKGISRSRVFSTISQNTYGFRADKQLFNTIIKTKKMREDIKDIYQKWFEKFHYKYQELFITKKMYINTILNLATFVYDNMTNIGGDYQYSSWEKTLDINDFTLEGWILYFKFMVLSMASHHQIEQEWLVKSDVFKIPPKSKIYIKLRELSTGIDQYESYSNITKEEVLDFIKQYNLDQKYTFEFIGSYVDISKIKRK